MRCGVGWGGPRLADPSWLPTVAEKLAPPPSAAPRTSPAAPAVPVEAAAWSPQSPRSDSCRETVGASRADRGSADSRRNGAFPPLSKALGDVRSSTPPRMEFPPDLLAQSRWKNSALVLHPRHKFPSEFLRWNSPAKSNSEWRHREDFFRRGFPAAAACFDSRRGARELPFAAQRDARPKKIRAPPSAEAA